MKPLAVSDAVVVPAGDLSWEATRASGPGGQNVNKVASKVWLRLDLERTRALDEETKARLRGLAGARLDGAGRLLVVSQQTRDQARNLEDARRKLAGLVLRALERKAPRRPTSPPRAAEERRVAGKRRRGEQKSRRRDAAGE